MSRNWFKEALNESPLERRRGVAQRGAPWKGLLAVLLLAQIGWQLFSLVAPCPQPFSGATFRKGYIQRFLSIIVVALFIGGICSAQEMSRDETKMLAMGKRAFQDKLYDISKANLSSFIEKYPKSPGRGEAQLLLGQTYFFLGDPAKALDQVKNPPANVSDELKPGYEYWTAQSLLAQGKWAEAEDRFQKLVESNPKSDLLLSAKLGLAQALFQNGKQQEAFDLLKELEALGLKHAVGQQASLARCKMLLASGKTQEAQDMLAQLAQQKPKPPLSFELLYWQGETEMKLGNFDDAIARFRALTADANAYPRSLVAEAWLHSGQAHVQKKEWQGAADDFLQAMKITKADDIFQQAADGFLSAQVNNKTLSAGAITLRDLALKRGEIGAAALFAIGKAFFDSGSMDAAITEFDQLARAFPQTAWAGEAGFMISSALEKKGDLEGAAQAIQKLIDGGRFPNRLADARMRLGELRFRQQKWDEATKLYLQAMEDAGDDADVRQKALFNVLSSFARQNKLEDFLKWEEVFNKAFPKNPTSDELLLLRADLLIHNNQAAKGRELLIDFATRNPKSPGTAEALYRAAESAFYDVDYEMVRKQDKKIETDYADSPYAFAAKFRRIQAEVRLNAVKAEDARKDWNAMISSAPKNPLVPSVLFELAQSYYEQQDFGSAQESFLRLANEYAGHRLSDDALYYAGYSAYRLNDYSGAITTFEKIPAESDLRVLARLAEVDCYRAQGNYDAALKIATVLTDSIDKKDPMWTEAALRRAATLYTMAAKDSKYYEEALKAANDVLAKGKDANSAQLNEAGFIKGKSLEKLGKPQAAIQAYLEVVYGNTVPEMIWPPQPEYRWFTQCGVEAAQMKEQQGDFKGAISIYRSMARLPGPNQAEFSKKIQDLRTRYFIPDEN